MEAVDAYKLAHLERTPDRAPADWAQTQRNLGRTLVELGDIETGTARFEEAVAVYKLVLADEISTRVPLQRAETQRLLGLALMKMGQRTRDADVLGQARAALEDSLKAFAEGEKKIYDNELSQKIAEIDDTLQQQADRQLSP